MSSLKIIFCYKQVDEEMKIVTTKGTVGRGKRKIDQDQDHESERQEIETEKETGREKKKEKRPKIGTGIKNGKGKLAKERKSEVGKRRNYQASSLNLRER